MAKVRIEFIGVQASGFQRLEDSPEAIYGEQEITVTSPAVLSNAAPTFGLDAGGASLTKGYARITIIAGAAIIAWGVNPVASEATGLRMEQGAIRNIQVNTGQFVSVIQAADAQSAAPTSDTTAEAALAAIAALLGGQLTTQISQLQAVSTYRGSTLAAAATAQDLMPANSARRGWLIQNQSSANLYVRAKGTAGTTLATQDQNSLIIPPGGYYEPPKITIYALSIIGPNAGQAFFSEEW